MTYILFNPLSNGGNGTDGVSAIQEKFKSDNPEALDLTALDTGAFLRGLTAEDRVILSGGDGTIQRLVNDLQGQAPAVPIYVWRFGTGNDFLRDAAPKGQQTLLLNEHFCHLATARLSTGETRFYLNGCSLGVDAVVCGMVEEDRKAAKNSSYADTALRSFFRKYKPVSGRVTVDGVTRQYDRIWMAAAMNGRYQGGGMKFAPDQDRNGDTLTCMVWHGTGALNTLLRFPFVIPGKHTGFSACDMRVGREITVELDSPTVIQMDGEVLYGVTGYTARK